MIEKGYVPIGRFTIYKRGTPETGESFSTRAIKSLSGNSSEADA